MKEEDINFIPAKDVFYNPAMRLCRSISSIAVGAIDEKIDIIDAFCASGIRGIRYAKENKNVGKISFVDLSKNAISSAKKNAKSNKLKAEFCHNNISKAAFELQTDFLEIDPFGTPAPYLVDAFRYFNIKKSAYLSVTATDVAVLCGGKTQACMKNYHSKPLNNEFTHETGLRIMLKKIAETAAEFNMGIEPLISFSDKHYLKSILSVKRSADLAFDSLKKLGYVSYCPKCGYRSSSIFPQNCIHCKTQTEFAGPLWLGDLHNKNFLVKMQKLNSKRNYSDKNEISKMLSLMVGEINLPPYYYNIHALCKIQALNPVPQMDVLLKNLIDSGFPAVRTHFSSVSIKTSAPYETILGTIESSKI
ncbi:tRNA (guanine(26)-N(2))-dimethyltransferase [Candidatus Bilamarchaeum dharawalense]|uniref:tRNA (guanine(26)-N(2))-dimethyltransferase n=1 Tax=Candidatus Bilamarchaeum dharawalense TaxID=2885759 RepID=A0A5E4LLX8_9ARCH|nr:tRNA (guanine(26)-N(2))-dimethyltransferase [Candidatus Bilamarchaeum dharawalense]